MKQFVLVLLPAVLLASCSKNHGAALPPPPLSQPLPNTLCPAPVPSVNTQISLSPGDASNPVIAATGRGFYVVWADWFGRFPVISGVTIDDSGIPKGEAMFFPGKGKCADPSIAADQENIYLGWMDGLSARRVQVGKNDEAPETFGDSVRHVAAGPYGALIFEERGTLYFRGDGRLGLPNRQGVVQEPVPSVVAQGGIESPAIAWTGDFYAVVWSASIAGGRDIRLQRMTNDGRKLGPVVKVSGVSGHNNRPEIVWTGTDFVVAWTNAAPAEQNPNGNFRIFLSVVPKEGVRPSLTKQLEFNGSADVVSLATTGAELAMAWIGTRAPAGSAVYFQRMDMKGTQIGEQIRVSDDQPIAVGRPDVVFANNGYAVVWHDSRDFEGSEIFYSFLSCSNAEVLPKEAATPEGDSENPELKSVF